MKLLKNYNPVWTKKHLDHMRKYKENYGLPYTEKEFEDEFDNIRRGQASNRCLGGECFEIYDSDEEYVGDITISKDNIDDLQLDLMIFDELCNKGYAKEAIRNLIDIFESENREDDLYAVVLNQNPNKKKVIHILEANGFELENENNYKNTYLKKFNKNTK